MILNPLYRLNRWGREREGFPIAPGAFPLVGHMPAMATDFLGLMRHAEREVGEHFWMHSGFDRWQLVCLHPDVFSIFKNKVTTSSYMREMLPDLFGGSLITLDGPEHQHARSAMNAPFLPRGLSASELGTVFAELIERRVQKWAGRELRILDQTRELVLAVMFRMLGVAEAELGAWREQYERFMMLAINVPFDVPGSPRRRGRRARAWLDERLLAYVRAARASGPDTPGLLSALVHGRDESGAALSDAELLDNLRLLVLAGHETSASTMAWMVVTLAERPDVWERLCDEAAAAGALPRSPKELRDFPYAEAVFRETLRLHPPVASDARNALTDFELAGRRVPAGTQVVIAICHLSRHESLYERPDEFRPERWLGRGEGISPVEMAQFGGGPHFCLGYHLAWMEIVQFAVALASVLSARGMRPRLKGAFPAPRYFPLLHPAASTRVAFA